MTSSQPVATPNAINFTPDNKHAYAYSGDIPITAGNTITFLDFETNSEYIKGQIQIGRNVKTSAEHEAFLYFKSELIFYSKMDNASTVTNQTPNSQPLEFIIPPFTHVEFKIKSSDSDTSQKTAIFIGEAFGMIDVGYQ